MSVLAPRGQQSAEEVVERDYGRLRRVVLNGMRSRLRQYGLRYDELDLEGFYNAAWLALHGRLSAGEEITNPEGFLIAVGVRRGIDDARRLRGLERDASVELDQQATEYDIDDELDRRTLLRHFREGLKEKLTQRECQAATLCLIIGYTRPKAAEMLGIAPKRMERIMDDAQRKITAFAPSITDGAWCDDHESLMRAYARRVLDPDGERYKFAKAHLAACPRCRRFVLGLRDVAPALTPLPLAGLHAGLLVHPVRIIRRALRHIIDIVRSPVASGKGGAAAGAGVGGGASVGVGSTLVGSGVGVKFAALCAAFCLVGGAAIVGVDGKGGPTHTRNNETRRRSVMTARRSAPSKPEALLTGNSAALQAAGLQASRSRLATSGRQRGHRRLIASRPAPRRTSSATVGSPQEFGFEGSAGSTPRSTSAQSPPPAKQASVARQRPSSHSTSSTTEFGFEGP
jgi:DNA-directed RNA polymerase specialized sigma24 family protein